MSQDQSQALYQRIDSIIQHLLSGLYERDEALRLSLLAALSGQSVFFLGPPGVAKSMVARRIAGAFTGARFFEYLMGRFSTPDELFGPVSIARLKHEDRYTRNTEGFLPDADIVFLDEIWKASPPIQNTLLGALNERTFRNGDEIIELPLKCFIAASNEIQQNDETRAFWDRFLIRLTLEPIADEEAFFSMIRSPAEDEPGEAQQAVSASEWSDWMDQFPSLEFSGDVLALLGDLRRAMAERAAEDPAFYVSDRRWKMISRLMKASAYYHGRNEVALVDSFIIPHCIWNAPEGRNDSAALFNRAVERTAFSVAAKIGRFHEDVGGFRRDLENSATEEVRREVLEPVRYDGEYLLFLPEEDAGERMFRIWADDLENLEDRGELELFVHERGNFTHTEIHKMDWQDRELQTLDGDLGPGRIDCRTRSETVTRPRPLNGNDLNVFSERFIAIAADLESGIRRVEDDRHALAEQASSHLFVPGRDIAPADRAAAVRTAELEQLLAELFELARSHGLSTE
jgi:MoxR-like ATPase